MEKMIPDQVSLMEGGPEIALVVQGYLEVLECQMKAPYERKNIRRTQGRQSYNMEDEVDEEWPSKSFDWDTKSDDGDNYE